MSVINTAFQSKSEVRQYLTNINTTTGTKVYLLVLLYFTYMYACLLHNVPALCSKHWLTASRMRYDETSVQQGRCLFSPSVSEGMAHLDFPALQNTDSGRTGVIEAPISYTSIWL